MQKKVTVVFSLVEESKSASKAEIIKDISDLFSNEEINIPWINKIEKITLK